MSLTLSQMRDELRLNLKRDSTALPDSRLTLWLNESQRRLAQLRTWEEMREIYTTSTVVGQSRYPFPARAKEFLSIRIESTSGNYEKLQSVAPRQADEYINDYDRSGTPEVYVDFGVNFELWPIPDAVYALKARISQFPADLSADSDVSALKNKDLLIILGATVLGFNALREVEEATAWENGQYRAALQAAIGADYSGKDLDTTLQPFTVPHTVLSPLNVFAGIR